MGSWGEYVTPEDIAESAKVKSAPVTNHSIFTCFYNPVPKQVENIFNQKPRYLQVDPESALVFNFHTGQKTEQLMNKTLSQVSR